MDILAESISGIGRLAASVDIGSTLSPSMQLQGKQIAAQFEIQLERASVPDAPVKTTEHVDAAKKFEAIVVAQMLTGILPKDSEYFGEGFAGDAWRSMMAEQLADVVVKQSDFGIARLIEQELAAKSQPGIPLGQARP